MRKLIEWIKNFLKGLFGYETPPNIVPPPLSQPVVTKPATPAETVKPQPLPTASVPPVPPQYGKRTLLTKPETFFFYSLLRAVDNGYTIFAKVRMGDVLYLTNEPTDIKQHKNNILCKHFDFVLCDRRHYTPILVIELDDKSHQWPGAVERDRLKDNICATAQLPVLRVEWTGKAPSPETLRHLIDETLAANLPTTPDNIPFSD